MESLEARKIAFIEDTHDKLRDLCQRPHVDPKSGVREVISDGKFESIAACLRDLGMEEASDRPRTFAVLHMMDRVALVTAFVVAGLLDNSFPYADRKSLPPLIRVDHDACHEFLDLQYHVMSAACRMENGRDSTHVHAESGDVFFQRIEKLGRGGEATVDRVRSRMTKQEYARKRIHRQKDLKKDKQILERFENELHILKRLDHTHLVRVFASYTDLKFVAILMKPVAEMDLKQYLRNWGGKSLTGSERERFRTYYGCLTSAISYLHDNNIRHKDIKPNNILLKRDDIYITDFGTAIEFDNDKSMTKGTVKVKTNQYQSPEVSRGTIRGKASDIWSLGVTFLEMTTVLRGESLDVMQAFFLETGTREAYVYDNIIGAIKWMEYLRKAAKQPRVDNSPQQWMKDMLEEKAIDRPTAQELFQSIKQAADGVFCRQCCHSDGSTESDTSSDSSKSDYGRDDDTIRPHSASTLKKNQPHPYENDVSFEKERPKQSVVANPVESTPPPQRAPLHRQVFEMLSSYLPSRRMPEKDKNLPISASHQPYTPPLIAPFTPAKEQTPEIESSSLYDPYECNLPGSFPGYSEISQYLISESTDIPKDVASKEVITDERPQPEIKSPAQLVSVESALGNLSPTLLVTEDRERPNKDSMSPFCDKIQGLIPTEDCLFNPGLNGFVAQIRGPSNFSFSTLQPRRRLSGTRSDENLQIQRKTNALLSNSEEEYENTPSDPRSRRFSEGSRDDFASQLSWETDVEELRKGKSESEDSSKTRLSPPAQGQQAFRMMPSRKKAATTEDFIIDYIHHTSQVYEAEALLDPNRPANDVENLNLITEPDTPRATDFIPQPRQLPERPKNNPLKAWFSQSRSPPGGQKAQGPLRFTGESLRIHNNEVPPLKKKSHPTFKIESASVYMQQVFNDTASSVATSVMSARTRKSMKLYGLMLPLQDRSSHFLERYTKAGKADAVRMLLREGCNPGTIKEPRPDPIFHVVRGASSRHTKCLRALIEHKVHVNVRAKLTRKTPLIEAVEQEAWSGYVTVIFLLLAAGANPNAKDGAGDVAILKLLGAGLKPLQEHRRKALALLLSTSYSTDVNVTPLGTGNNPLHLAIRRVDPWALSMLLEKDDSLIEAKNSEGLTPLSLACSAWTSTITSGQLEILDVLLEKKANVNVNTTANGKTPLHTAVSLGLVDAVERLLVKGADPLRKTKDDKKAQDMAKERKKQHGCNGCADCTEIRFLLERHISNSTKNEDS